MSNEQKAQQQLQLAGEAFHRGDQRASLEAYKKAFLAAPLRWQYRYFAFAGASSLLEGEDGVDERANVIANERDLVFLKVALIVAKNDSSDISIRTSTRTIMSHL